MPLEEIGAYVRSGQPIAFIATHNGDMMVYSKIDGILRGMIRPGFEVWAGLKIADVDPRGREENCATVSDKARALGGAVLEALLARGITP
jgi:xanthine dehydrogenase accessory factor